MELFNYILNMELTKYIYIHMYCVHVLWNLQSELVYKRYLS
jgi:hypothetical protein